MIILSDFYPYATSNIPPGGDAGQVLTKESDKSYDVGWHNVGDINVENSIKKYFESLTGKSGQVLGFDKNGKLVAMDISIPPSTSEPVECECPDIVTDEEFDEWLSDVFS